MRWERRLVRLAAAAALVFALAAPASLAAPPITSLPGFSAPCPAYSSATGQPTSNPGPRDVRICSGQVPSFDGAYLDVDLTMPINDGGPPHPLMFMANGFGSDKHYWESNTDEGDSRDLYHWNNHWFATHGYYVLTYTPRGFRGQAPSQDFPGGRPNTPPGDSSPTGGPVGGSPSPTPSPQNATDATIRLKSIEFEVRDTEWLMALIAASYNVNPQQLAATGDSYGGGESWLLASQDHFSFPNGIDSNGKQGPLEFQVTVPKYGWTDLGYSLAPNGHRGPFPTSAGGCDEATANDPCYSASSEGPYRPSTAVCFDASLSGQGQGDPTTACNPFGVPKDSYLKGLFALGQTTGVYEGETASTDPSLERTEDGGPGQPNILGWNTRTLAGDPFDVAGFEADPIVQQIRRGLTNFRSSYYQTAGWQAQAGTDPATGKPRHKVAIFSIQGWTDDLFEPLESFREFKYLKSLDRLWPVEVALGDVGHSRAQNLPDDWHPLNDQAWQFLQSNINGSHDQQTIISSQPTKCPDSTDPANSLNADQRLTATTPEGLHNGRLTITYTPGATNVPTPPDTDPDNQSTDPIFGGLIFPTGEGCRTSQTPTYPGRYTNISKPLSAAATYVGQGVVKVPYSFVGAPPTTAVLAARVWEVEPNGNTLLMTRGVYRLDIPAYDQGSGELRIPLFGNQWPLLPGDRIRLDLTQVDQFGGPGQAAAGMFQKSNVPSAITIGTQDDPPQLILPTRNAGDTSLSGSAPTP